MANIPPIAPIAHASVAAPGSPRPVPAAQIGAVPTAGQVYQEHVYVDNIKRQRQVHGANHIPNASVGHAIIRAHSMTNAAAGGGAGQLPGPIPVLPPIPGIPAPIIIFANAVAATLNQVQNDVAVLQNDVAALQNNVAALQNNVAALQNDVGGIRVEQIVQSNQVTVSLNRGSRQTDALGILRKSTDNVAAVGNEPLRPRGFARPPQWNPNPVTGSLPVGFDVPYPATMRDLGQYSRGQIAALGLFYDTNFGIVNHNASVAVYREAFARFIGAILE